MARNYYQEPNPNSNNNKPPTAGLVGGGLAGVAALFKFGLLSLGSLKSLLFMGLYLAVQAQYLGWAVALGVVVLIFIHEMGHAYMAIQYGREVTPPMFIPFFGAVVYINNAGLTGWQRAMTAIAGPIAGGLGSFAFWCVGIVFHQDWMVVSAALSIFINLFNLAPIGFLDGARVCSAVHPQFWIAGLLAVIGLIYYINPYALYTLFIMGLPVLIISALQPKNPADLAAYEEMRDDARIGVALIYILTGVALAGGTLLLQTGLPDHPYNGY
jgi:Zn-dependent protease